MGVVRSIKPKLKFPKQVPFEITDKFNGPHRGTWWFIDNYDGLRGPFWTWTQAQEAFDEEMTISPHQDQYGSWWWTDEKQGVHGPYTNLRDADAAIVVHLNKDHK